MIQNYLYWAAYIDHMPKPDMLVWPVHYQVTETQRTLLENFARENGVSLSKAARTLLGEAMKARGIC